jgi:glycosyltransferase involved in cell wall biosynthesis
MASAVLPNTRVELEMIRDAFAVPQDKLSILPNGVSERFAAASPEAFVTEFGLSDFALYVGHIGWERKNVLPLIRALLESGRPGVFIGTVIENRYGKQCRELIAGSRLMRHIPALPADSPLLASAYAAAEVLVQPAFYETPGLAALEAGLAGAKICTTKHGGTVEYFGDMADYLEPSDPASIRNALGAAFARPRSNALRDHIRNHYLWSHAGQRLAEIYHNVAN